MVTLIWPITLSPTGVKDFDVFLAEQNLEA
jgi:hypothetical protein